MKLNFLTLFFISFFCLCSHGTIRVLIDPGHGGADRGASYDGVNESMLVLSVSKELHSLFTANPKFSSTLSRKDDSAVALRYRVDKSENFDLLLSLHANASVDFSGKGLEVFVMTDEDALKETVTSVSRRNDLEQIKRDLVRSAQIRQSAKLGKKIISHWREPLSKKPAKALKQNSLYVLQNAIHEKPKPTLLIELGYLTDSEERSKLQDKNWQKQRAKDIYRAVLKYFDETEVGDKGANSQLE